MYAGLKMSGTQDVMQQYKTSQIAQHILLVLTPIVTLSGTVSSIDHFKNGTNFLLALDRLLHFL